MSPHVIAAAVALAAGGCASVPETVRVPIPVPCVDEIPARPAIASDSDLLAMDDRALVLAIARDRERLIAHAETLEAILIACRSDAGASNAVGKVVTRADQ